MPAQTLRTEQIEQNALFRGTTFGIIAGGCLFVTIVMLAYYFRPVIPWMDRWFYFVFSMSIAIIYFICQHFEYPDVRDGSIVASIVFALLFYLFVIHSALGLSILGAVSMVMIQITIEPFKDQVYHVAICFLLIGLAICCTIYKNEIFAQFSGAIGYIKPQMEQLSSSFCANKNLMAVAIGIIVVLTINYALVYFKWINLN